MPHVSINGTFAKCVWKNKSFHLDAFFLCLQRVERRVKRGAAETRVVGLSLDCTFSLLPMYARYR